MNPPLVCDGCGEVVPNPYGEWQADHGLSVPVSHMGGYGQFTDHIGSEDDDEWFVACHDCVLRLLAAFPGLAAKMRKHMRGHHPNKNWVGWSERPGSSFPPCCEYSWTWDVSEGPDGKKSFTTFVAKENGEWEKISD